MSFLQPMLLAALPLVALPIVIHLINQRRYQTMRWAAMMFLLAANRMSRGYARLRQWFILALRMLAIAALLFAVSRPLAGGWLGLTGGGRPDTTIVLIDRSPSMQQNSSGGGGSKLETGRRQLAQTLKTLGSARWMLMESGTNAPREFNSPDALLTMTSAEPTSASSDIPGMLLASRDAIRANKSGRTEIWICSDLRENDWNAESGRWPALRDGFLEFSQAVRVHLLAYPRPAAGNLSVRVTETRFRPTADAGELLVSLRLRREGGGDAKGSIPVQLEIDGARSEVTVDMTGPVAELKDHRIPLGKGHDHGWGRVSIPADSNPADNDFWFAFDPPVARHTVLVAEDAQKLNPFQLAASISTDPSILCDAEIVAADQLAPIEWEQVSLLIWQAPLPEGANAKVVRSFIERGGRVLFMPPRIPGTGEFLGAKWTSWKDEPNAVSVESWRGDEDLLAHTQSGAALPVGELQIQRHCGLNGEFIPLATLRGGAPLLSRVVTNSGGVYFLTTTPAVGDSSMATGGVVLYVLVQRALAAGSSALGNARQLVAGESSGTDPSTWKRLAGTDPAVSTEYPFHAGVYQSGDRLFAVNRPLAEDDARVLADGRVSALFRDLDFSRVDDQAGSLSSLIQEVWRVFLVSMMLALIAEAALCLPKPSQRAKGSE